MRHCTARVKEGEVVLVHAGASGVGTAAIQLVRLAGAVPVVTAGSPEKLQIAKELGAAAGFNYRKENFAEKVCDFTKGRSLIRDKPISSHSDVTLFKKLLFLLR